MNSWNENRQVAMLQSSSKERMWENYRMEIMELHRSQSVWKESQVSSISNLLLHKKEDKTEHSGGKKERLYISLFQHVLWKQTTARHSGHTKQRAVSLPMSTPTAYRKSVTCPHTHLTGRRSWSGVCGSCWLWMTCSGGCSTYPVL